MSSELTAAYTYVAVLMQFPQGNTDGQDQTNFGEADTYQVPWYVIPDNVSTLNEILAHV